MVDRDSSAGGPRRLRDGGSAAVTSILESVIGCKWSVRLLQLCSEGCRRPSAMLRACPGLSAKVLNERLRKMTRLGILQRTVFGEKPPVTVEYRLTPLGSRFMTIIAEVRRLQEDVDRGVLQADALEERDGAPEPPADSTLRPA